jgi:hypothetical protein
VRETLARCLAARDDQALSQLTVELEAAASLPVRVDAGPHGAVFLGFERERGPWVAYLPSADGSGGWLALGWRPVSEAPAMRGVLPLEVADRFMSGPIGPAQGCRRPELCEAVLVAVYYPTADLPPEHRLLNDLHAVVMLHGLLAEST